MSLWRLSHRLARPLPSKQSLRMSIRSNSAVSTPSQTTSPAIVAPPPPKSSYIRGTRKPIGGFRGGITGFLLGTSIAAAYGYYYLLTTLSSQSTLLNGAISDLQTSTAALQSYISKIDSLEQDFKKLEGKVIDKEGIGEIRGEFKKVIGGVRGEGLELKERIAGLEKDVAMLTRSARTHLQPQP